MGADISCLFTATTAAASGLCRSHTSGLLTFPLALAVLSTSVNLHLMLQKSLTEQIAWLSRQILSITKMAHFSEHKV